jgi:predicted nucleic acid-binding protein
LSQHSTQSGLRGAHDLIIAATAIASDRSVISADTGGFTGLSGLDVIRQQ